MRSCKRCGGETGRAGECVDRNVQWKAKVTVTRLVAVNELDADDRNDRPDLKVHEFEVTAPNQTAATTAALDEFHETVPIACLEDFDIRCFTRKVPHAES